MRWWQRVFSRRKLEDQLEKELRFHLEEQARALEERGADPAEAQRLSRLAFGGVEQIKEECRDARGTRWLEDFCQDIRQALRTLRQNPGFAAVVLLTLALGTGAITVMFTVIDGVLLRPLPYREPERLLVLHGRTEKYGENWGASYLDFLDLQRQSKSLEPAAWTDGGGTLSGSGDPEYVGGVRISANLFSVLGIPMLQGRGFLPEEDRPGGRPVIIISSCLWHRRYGGGAGAIGSSLNFNGKAYTVIGIVGPAFQLVDYGDDEYTPLGQNWDDPRMQNRAARFIHVMARLRPGANASTAEAELDLIGRRLAREYPRFDAGRQFIAHALGQELVRDVRATLWLLLGAVGAVLLIACANIANLLLTRAISREREIAMRAALGATRGRLIRQCLTESFVLAFGGGGLGVAAAVIGIRPFVKLWPESLPRAEQIAFDWRVLVFALAASVMSGLVFGLAPGLRVPVRDLERILRAGGRTAVATSRGVYSAFVVCELALAVVLLVAAGMLGRTLLDLSSLDPGINVHHVITARVELAPQALTTPAAMRADWQDFVNRARSVPGVESVALADIIPMREGENTLGYWTTPETPPPDRIPIALASCVSPDYLKVMGIPLRRGRFFSEQDRIGSVPVVVIDEVMAQHAFGARQAVGQRLWIQGLGPGPVQVIGVVGHVRHWGLVSDDQSKIRDQVYYPFEQVPDRVMRLLSSVMSVAVRTRADPLSVVEPLRHAAHGGTGDPVFHDVWTPEHLAGASIARQRFLLLLFGIFAGLALLLACLGIYGVLAYLTGRRVGEIGVRMALGANAGDVIGMVLRHSLIMISIGAGIGLAASIAVGSVLQHSVAGMRPAEPATFAIMTAVLVAAALAASFVPARRASRIDPMSALRQD